MRTGSLRRGECLPICIVLFALLGSSIRASARIAVIPSIQQITSDSDLIAVVEVGQTRDLGRADLVDSQGKQIAGRRRATDFLFEEVLTGSVDGDRVEVQFDSNPEMYTGPITPSFSMGKRMMIFLRCKTQGCSFTRLDTPGFYVAGRSALVPGPPEPGDVYLRVLQRLAAGLFTDSGEKRRSGDSPTEVFLLTNERNQYVSTIFKAALAEAATQTDVELRGELIAALVRRGEVSVLPQLEDFLFTGDSNEHSNTRGNLILSLQQIDWHISLPIAARALRLPSASLRTMAARSIQNLHMEQYTPHPDEMSAPATRILLTTLHDPDPEVAFAVMQSLGELNARHDERPTSTIQDAQWTACLRFWEDFQTSLK